MGLSWQLMAALAKAAVASCVISITGLVPSGRCRGFRLGLGCRVWGLGQQRAWFIYLGLVPFLHSFSLGLVLLSGCGSKET
jgi:hypothetical protein